MGIGTYRHVVEFQTLTSVPDGDGGQVETWAPLGPPWAAEIRPANVRDLERRTAGTIVGTATHVVTARYRADVKIDGRMIFAGRMFRIAGVTNDDERGITMEIFAAETV